MNMKPTVSINLCVLNGGNYIREALESIVAQTYNDWELVVINDGSTDATESIIKEYISQGYPIIYCWQENHGLGYSRNEALKRSQGKYIAFIDHDDIWLSDKLEKQISLFSDNTDIDFIYTNYFIMKNNQKLLTLKRKQPTGYVFEYFLYHYPVALLTAMIRKNALIGRNIEFDENLHLSEEYDVFMRLLYKSKAGYIKDPLAIYRIHPQMASLTRASDYYEESLYVLKKIKAIDDCQAKFKKALKIHKMNSEYVMAKNLIDQGDSISGRKQISAYKLLYFKHFMLYLFSFIPTGVRHYLNIIFSKNYISQHPTLF